MRRLFVLILSAALAASALAQAAKPAPAKPAAALPDAPSAKTPSADGGPSNETVESFLKYMFSYDPKLKWKVLAVRPSPAPQISEVIVGITGQDGQQQMMQFFVTPDQNWAIPAGDMLPFGAKPFGAANAQLDARAKGPARGPENAEITLVEFSDLQCPACKAAQPTIEKLWADFPQARFVFQNYPLDNIHPWALKAAEYGDCVARASQEAFWKFLALDYQNQETITVQNVDEKMKGFAAEAGVDAATIAACVADPSTAARVRESSDLAKAVFVSSTPTLFVNGRRVPNFTGMPYDVLKQVIQGTPR